MSDDHLPHLLTFVCAADFGSFTVAARVLKITQAAVSQRIHQLETEIGCGLFHRRGGRITLTTAGRKLLAYGKRITDLHAEARSVIADLKPELKGRLVIAASSIPGSHLLPPKLATYRRGHPRVNVCVRGGDSKDVLRLVESGEAELGFAGDSGESRHLVFEPFSTDELALVVPASHPFSERRRIGLREFFREPLILREYGSGSRHCLEQALTSLGRDPTSLHVVLEVDGNEAIKQSVLQGLGVAVLSRRTVQHEVLNGTVRLLAITGLRLVRDLFIVKDRRRPLSTTAQDFLSHLQILPTLAS